MQSDSKLLRLHKYIADCGVTSRRKAEELVATGRVKVNDEIVRTLGTKIDPENDVVFVDERPIGMADVEKIYLILNKPRCYLTTVHDPEGRPTVMDLVQTISERIYPVGRLDYLSEGLLIMTNDGEVANLIMHPKHNVIKVYEVKVFGAITESILKKLRNGVEIDGDKVKPLSVRVIKQLRGKTWLEFRLGEGKNREIRKFCEACGVTVDKLKRMAIGNLTVEGIAPGNVRSVSKKALLDMIGLTAKGATQAPYFSPKKSIDIKKKGPQTATPADHEGFRVYRRELYFNTIKTLKERKATEE